jgi:hypothetical protein
LPSPRSIAFASTTMSVLPHFGHFLLRFIRYHAKA